MPWSRSLPAHATLRPMTKRERVMAALRGEPVDRVPLAFWLHNFATENSSKGLAEETLRLLRRFDWDFLKPQSRAQCFAEMWGLAYAPSDDRTRPYTVTHTPVEDAAGLAALRPVDPSKGALGEQLEALRLIRAAVGPAVPIIWTIFSPLMILPMLVRGGRDRALALARSASRETDAALAAMAETLAAYARACVEAGADGLFYATNVATRDLISAEECRRWQRPWDRLVLEAAAGAPFNVLHVCGSGVQFDEFADYPVHALSWAVVPDNPTLQEGHRRSGRASMGGLPAKPVIASFTTQAMAERARAAIAATAGRWLLLAPDCSIDPATPDELLRAARTAVGAG